MSNNRELGYVVGAVAGYFTGGASYIALGATIGGVVGGLLDPKTQTQGPRLDDLKVQFSSYGVGIPTLYGTERISPNVIWSTDKIEQSSTTSSGKGGGGTENTSFRYYVHMGLMLCETPRDGAEVQIVQIFQDGKLIYDANSGISVASALASSENPYAFFVLYQGHADQLPDPIEELMEGVGNVPAYRGIVRIRMNAIECPGGRVPQFSFVLSRGATIGPSVTQQVAASPDPARAGAIITKDGIWEFSANADSGHFNIPFSFGTVDSLQQIGTMSVVDGGQMPYPVSGATSTPQIIKPYNISGELHLLDLQNRSDRILYLGGANGTGTLYGRAAYDPSVDLYAVSSWDTGSTGNDPIIINGAGAAIPVTPIAGDGHGGVLGFFGGVVHVVTTDGTNIIYSRRTQEGLYDASMPDTTGPAVSFSPRWSALYVDINGVYLYSVPVVGGNGTIYKIIPATIAGPGEFRVLAADSGTSTANAFTTSSRTFYANDSMATIGPILSVPTGYNLVRYAVVDPGTGLVADIIAAECERAGETRYDVSAIGADSVQGYKIGSPASARANIDPLMAAFQIFIVDEDEAIVFKKYSDIASVADITFDELGQAESGSEPSDAMPLNRTQEIDMPRSVSVSYIEPLNDYQTATETETRQVTDATEDMLVQLPIALGSSDQAKTAASSILFSRWRAQNTRSLTVSRKFAFLSPGDGVTVEYPQGTSRLWRITSMNDTGAVIELSVEPGDASLYTQAATGATGYVPQQVSPLPAPTRAVVLDIPILRDIDNNAGPYVAFDSYSTGSAGAELFIGNDDTNLVPRGTVSASAPIGFAETALGAFSAGVVDEANLVTVALGDDEFESVTRDVLLAGGGEYWAYGAPGRWEIGASAVGDSLGGGRYTLSRHMRGLFGTERNTGLHLVGDTFILLHIAGMLRPDTGTASIGQVTTFRVVSKGRSSASVTSQTFTNTGEGLMPLSPINARRSTVSNDITLTWDRRSRLAMNNSTGTLPLGEASEAYAVVFYTSSGFTIVAGTLTTGTASLTITSAQQTAFGLTPGAVVHVRIYQVSDTVGLGHYLEANL